MRARKVSQESNVQAAWIILDDPDRYAGLPLLWAKAWLKQNGLAHKPAMWHKMPANQSGCSKPVLVRRGAVQTGIPTCPECGSERLEYLSGYFESGVCGPNGEPEMYWREAIRCRDCGEVEEF